MAVLPIKDRRYLTHRGITFEEIDEPQKAVVLVGADPILTHPANPILTRGWTLAA